MDRNIRILNLLVSEEFFERVALKSRLLYLPRFLCIIEKLTMTKQKFYCEFEIDGPIF